MAGILDINELLASMSPELVEGDYVFCSVAGDYVDHRHLHPLASFSEPEGLTLIISADAAEAHQMQFNATFRQITLRVHSSLQAVGLTAAVATKLASEGISANVVAAYYHDHIFVPSEKADQALAALRELCVKAD